MTMQVTPLTIDSIRRPQRYTDKELIAMASGRIYPEEPSGSSKLLKFGIWTAIALAALALGRKFALNDVDITKKLADCNGIAEKINVALAKAGDYIIKKSNSFIEILKNNYSKIMKKTTEEGEEIAKEVAAEATK